MLIIRGKKTVLLLGWTVLASYARAQTLEQVVEKGIAAAGGAEKIHSVQALRMTGSISFGDAERHPITVELQRPARIRTEIGFGEKGQVISAFDGERGWKINPFSGSAAAVAMSQEEERGAREQADFDGPLVDWQKRGISVSLLPLTRVEGKSAYELEVVLPGGAERFLYLDAATGLKVQWEGAVEQNGKKAVFQSLFDDYRAVDGLPMPYRIRSRAQGSERTQIITFDKIEVSPTIPASRFRLPAAATTPKTASPGRVSTESVPEKKQ